MKDVLFMVAGVFLLVLPYALITLGVYTLTGEIGWAMIILGVLILATVFAVAGLR